ncbi:hypothetical protein DIZ81_00935 [Legionella taurinensis]|uniref:Uncharacterized protein n=1 Tax=Legionella taurinensis TaxID=70611 RepID=A0A3A5LHH4_9GAMM|nr:hypothetical protein [Legionella taurinensis]MDX1836559.1 hypothetical protein [Legionella taurinensis]PUT42978.1 hypothetical protein DB744_00940 [Legionella taurinensis]PUT45533.1 hypothetical protein DB746_00940 [Legionella taurinensis]PUT46892.1 hypothetical protein DB743_03060 [Legionella taurinensis]PUT49300.1 hypothetical protein DB745_00940 [Legionella taurinensis]
MSVSSHISDLLSLDKASRCEQLLSTVTQLHSDELMDCFSFFMGNDPIRKSDLTPYQATKPFVLVGTSIFGAIAIACHLGEQLSAPPQVVIVDLSHQVVKSWDLIKSYFMTSAETNPELAVKGFWDLLQTNRPNEFSMDGDSDDLRAFLLGLIEQYGLVRFKQLVIEAVILKQSWGHEATFQQIRDVYKDMDIVAYPSNIIHCIHDLKTQKDVARCVNLLQPVLSIQTNLQQGEPTQLHLMKDNSVRSIMRTLGPGPFLKDIDQLAFEGEFLAPSLSASAMVIKPGSVPGMWFAQSLKKEEGVKAETGYASVMTSFLH